MAAVNPIIKKMRSFSLSKSTRKISVALNPNITEEFQLDQNAPIDDVISLIIQKYPSINPTPSTQNCEIHVANFKSRRVVWGTIVKNLIKEQLQIAFEPPLMWDKNGQSTSSLTGSNVSSSSQNVTSKALTQITDANNTSTTNPNNTSVSSVKTIGDSTDELVEEITSPPKTTLPSSEVPSINTTPSATSTTAPKVNLHLLLNKLTSQPTITTEPSAKVVQSSTILFGGQMESHFPSGASLTANSIPPVLEKMLSYLKQDRVQRTAGIFRLTGSVAERDRFIQMLNEAQAKNGDLYPVVFPNSIDPNVLCNLLLEYLKRADKPLLDPFQKFVEISDAPSEAERIRLLKKAINDEMEHTIHRNVLKEILYYLVQLLLYKEENRLNVKSLSVIFGPILLRGKIKDENEERPPEEQLKKNVGATTLITTRQISQRMVEFYVSIVGCLLEHFSSIFDEDGIDTRLHHKRKHKDSAASPTTTVVAANSGGAKTLNAFLQKLQEHKQTQSSTASSTGSLPKRPGESTSNLPATTPREPKKPTTRNDEEWETIQKSWMQFVESWKKKYNDEKLAHEQTAEEIKLKEKEIEFERSQMKEQISSLKDQLDDKRKVVVQKRREWELQKEQIALNWENEKIELEKEKVKRQKEIQESRESFKQTLEYYGITNFQIDSVMGDEEEDEVSRIAGSTAEKEEQLIQKETDESTQSRNLRTVVGQKIAVDSRFKRRPTVESPTIEKSKGSDDEDDSSSDEEEQKTKTKTKSIFFDEGDDKTPQSSVSKPTDVFKPKSKEEESSSDDDATQTRRCGACKKKITGEYMETSDSYFHKTCFVCCNCTNEINGPFANVSGKFWCADCIKNKNKNVKYQTKDEPTIEEKKQKQLLKAGEVECNACKEKIVNKTDMVKALGKTYHKQCFVCQRCGNEFENMKFYDLMGDPVCATCKRKSIKSKAVK